MTRTTTSKLKKVEIKYRPSLTETLKSLEIGVGNLFSIRDYKAAVVRSAATKLKSSGYGFSITEEGMIDEYIVTRLR